MKEFRRAALALAALLFLVSIAAGTALAQTILGNTLQAEWEEANSTCERGKKCAAWFSYDARRHLYFSPKGKVFDYLMNVKKEGGVYDLDRWAHNKDFGGKTKISAKGNEVVISDEGNFRGQSTGISERKFVFDGQTCTVTVSWYPVGAMTTHYAYKIGQVHYCRVIPGHVER